MFRSESGKRKEGDAKAEDGVLSETGSAVYVRKIERGDKNVRKVVGRLARRDLDSWISRGSISSDLGSIQKTTVLSIRVICSQEKLKILYVCFSIISFFLLFSSTRTNTANEAEASRRRFGVSRAL